MNPQVRAILSMFERRRAGPVGTGQTAPVIVAIGGLPGVGKTTVARAVAARLPAAHLRIDALEVALLRQRLVATADVVGAHGYAIALAVADTCLAAGTHVVVDAVFDVAEARDPWLALADRHSTAVDWFRLVCSDRAEHRRRVDHRAADITGHRPPTWSDVEGRLTEPWTQPHSVVDTARPDPGGAVLHRITTVGEP